MLAADMPLSATGLMDGDRSRRRGKGPRGRRGLGKVLRIRYPQEKGPERGQKVSKVSFSESAKSTEESMLQIGLF